MSPALRRLALPIVLLSAPLATGAIADPPSSLDDRDAVIVPSVATGAACSIEPGPRSTTSFLWTSPDAYSAVYWKIPACASCTAGQGLQIDSVSFRVRWVGACTATAIVSVVGSKGPAGCTLPDTTVALCPPVTRSISGSSAVIHSIAMSPSCVPVGSFLRIRFIGMDACYPAGQLSPGLTVATAGTACPTCQQYFSTTVGHPGFSEWCNADTVGAGAPIWIHLVADCCTTVGVGAAPAPPASRIEVLRDFARPIRLEIELAGSAERPVDVGVFDVAGRRVRTLLREDIGGGSRTLEWDGLSDDGRRARPGVYRVRLRDGTRIATASAILME